MLQSDIITVAIPQQHRVSLYKKQSQFNGSFIFLWGNTKNSHWKDFSSIVKKWKFCRNYWKRSLVEQTSLYTLVYRTFLYNEMNLKPHKTAPWGTSWSRYIPRLPVHPSPFLRIRCPQAYNNCVKTLGRATNNHVKRCNCALYISLVRYEFKNFENSNFSDWHEYSYITGNEC